MAHFYLISKFHLKFERLLSVVFSWCRCSGSSPSILPCPQQPPLSPSACPASLHPWQFSLQPHLSNISAILPLHMFKPFLIKSILIIPNVNPNILSSACCCLFVCVTVSKPHIIASCKPPISLLLSYFCKILSLILISTQLCPICTLFFTHLVVSVTLDS